LDVPLPELDPLNVAPRPRTERVTTPEARRGSGSHWRSCGWDLGCAGCCCRLLRRRELRRRCHPWPAVTLPALARMVPLRQCCWRRRRRAAPCLAATGRTDERPSASVDLDLAGGLLPAPARALLPFGGPPRFTSYDPTTWEALWRESEVMVGLPSGGGSLALGGQGS
ncbi:unnamed protein product, partial [Prorocentrum cordatum]